MRVAALGALTLALAVAGVTQAAGTPDTLGVSTAQERIVPTSNDGFRTLQSGPGEDYTVRDGVGAEAQAGREARRKSLLYFGQLSDFQLADEESPARVEALDPVSGGLGLPFDAAWRPWESLEPQIDDASIRQLNAFAAGSPIADGDGHHRTMDFALDTGDSADSQQLNETKWVRTLLEGGSLNPNSGVDPTGSLGLGCIPGLTPGAAEAAKYTGVQDYNDYFEGTSPAFYDPDHPAGDFSGFPSYPGLMDRSEQPFDAAGVHVPTYVTFGNHDGLAQGNQAANGLFEAVGTGCLKPTGLLPSVDPTNYAAVLASITPANLVSALVTDPTKIMFVPPDPERQFVSKKQYKEVFEDGTQADGHGFDYIDPDQESASHGSAGYYSWSPKPGFRFISLDTVSEGGIVGISAEGNVDDPQFQWLKGQLDAADAADQLVVIFSHHAIVSLTADLADEAAPPCTVNDSHGHDINPGCDNDPRTSTPIHLGPSLEALLHQHSHVIAWVAGHSHVNDVTPYPDGNGGGFWSIRTAAEADWPQQERLLDIMDNEDGTLSIFGTILDHASNVTAPASGTNASGMDEADLASIGRTLSYNDNQVGARECDPACGEGTADDRNVELLLKDPRASAGPPPPPPPPGGGGACKNVIRGDRHSNHLGGTPGSDSIHGYRGRDTLNGYGGKDCLYGGRGRDVLRGGPGQDRLYGQSGRDRIKGGSGNDSVHGGAGSDVINVRGGGRDVVHCGRGGEDLVRADRDDLVFGCETIRF